MSFDGLVTRAVAHECDTLLTSGRITRIYQPASTDIVLHIRAKGKNHRLFLSANLTFPRIHLTHEEFTNPLEPPMFCMLLRKHCESAIITSIEQPELERVIHINLHVRDEIGDWRTRRLVIEIMGRHSNIILLDPERNLILDGIHHVTPSMSSHRVVLPGRPYLDPPDQNKKNPLHRTKEGFIQSFDYNSGRLDKQIVSHFSGISPQISREIIHRTGMGGRDEMWNAFQQLMESVDKHEYHPEIVSKDQRSYFSITRLSHLGDENLRLFDSVSNCLESFFQGRAERNTVKQKERDLFRFVHNEAEKNRKKVLKLNTTRKKAQAADEYRMLGELLTAYLHEVQKGADKATVPNYYEEDAPMIEIKLDPQLTPAENAQSFYKKYNKARNSIKAVGEQIKLANREIEYFNRITQQLDGASMDDIEEIREELTEGGYIRARKRKKRKNKKNAHPTLEVYQSTDGTEILVGKNNKQNEYLTSRVARSTDTWLHTKDIPGSHVVIRSPECSDQTILEAATISAYYSQARESSQVPVDYTLVKHVRKPKGAKPGHVIYDNQKTVYVTPDESSIQQLVKNAGT